MRYASGSAAASLIEPDSAVGCHRCVTSLHWVNHGRLRDGSTGVIGRVRLARSDADRGFGTGAACRRFD